MKLTITTDHATIVAEGDDVTVNTITDLLYVFQAGRCVMPRTENVIPASVITDMLNRGEQTKHVYGG